MYEGNVAYTQTAATIQEKPELAVINDRFQRENGIFLELCVAIQEKLHNIVNLRTPEKESTNEKGKPIVNSFVDAANENLYNMQLNNGRLERILQHVNRLV